MKKGQLHSWSSERGFGIIWVTRVERFFLHITNAPIEIAEPKVGDWFEFDVAPPFKKNGLPLAVNVRFSEAPKSEDSAPELVSKEQSHDGR